MRLYIFQYGVTHDGNPIPGYLIITADQRHILVDTGFPASEGGAAAAPDFVKPEDHVLQHLAGIDLTPDDIEIVICTHFDPDHAGANELFTSAELIVQRRHDEFVRSTPVDRFEVYRPSWDYPGLRYRLVDGDTVIAPGVEVIDTSGHVPGHQSVLVRLPETGPVLLAIDALHHDPATPYEPGAFDMSPTDTAASIEKLKVLIEREGVTLTVFGHNGEQWATLRHAPEYYA